MISGLAEDLIAGVVAVEVVGLREVVKIDRQDGRHLRSASCACERVLERGDRRRSVRQRGQAVVGGLVRETFLERIAVLDRARQDPDRILQRGSEPTWERDRHDLAVEVACRERVRLGLEQSQVADQRVKRVGHDRCLGRAAGTERLDVEMTLDDRARRGREPAEGPGDRLGDPNCHGQREQRSQADQDQPKAIGARVAGRERVSRSAHRGAGLRDQVRDELRREASDRSGQRGHADRARGLIDPAVEDREVPTVGDLAQERVARSSRLTARQRAPGRRQARHARLHDLLARLREQGIVLREAQLRSSAGSRGAEQRRRDVARDGTLRLDQTVAPAKRQQRPARGRAARDRQHLAPERGERHRRRVLQHRLDRLVARADHLRRHPAHGAKIAAHDREIQSQTPRQRGRQRGQRTVTRRLGPVQVGRHDEPERGVHRRRRDPRLHRHHVRLCNAMLSHHRGQRRDRRGQARHDTICSARASGVLARLQRQRRRDQRQHDQRQHHQHDQACCDAQPPSGPG